MNYDFDILINGGGMVGATLACALLQADHKSSLRLGIIEGQAFVPNQEEAWALRVSAITCASQRLFEYLGAWSLMQAQRVSPFNAMDVWDAEGTGRIQFFAQELGEPCLGHIIENNVIQQALNQRLQEMHFSHTFCPDHLLACERYVAGWRVHLSSGETLTTRLLIGADGALSKVRDLFEFNLKIEPYHHHSIVTTVRTEKSNGAVARQCFLNTGPLALLPLRDVQGNRHHCSVVWSVESQMHQKLMSMDENSFAQALTEASENCLGRVEWVDHRISFPLYARHVDSYVREGVALCGDAAHTIHPLAGQGVNLGLMDAAVLAEEIHRASDKGLDITDFSVLRRYERRRRGANTLMLESMHGFKSLFEADLLPFRWARNAGMSWMNQLPPLKNKVMRYAMGLEGDVPDVAKGTMSRLR